MRNPFRRKPAPLPGPVPLATIAPPAVFNPTNDQAATFAAYRADAIARDIEQRRDEGHPDHPQRDQIIAEAMSYAWMLVRAGKWTHQHVVALEQRLTGQ